MARFLTSCLEEDEEEGYKGHEFWCRTVIKPGTISLLLGPPPLPNIAPGGGERTEARKTLSLITILEKCRPRVQPTNLGA